jgi:streptogramin lyase
MIAGQLRRALADGRGHLWAFAVLGLAACVAEPDGVAPREAQAAECADVVAEHVGAAPRMVAVAWAGDADGSGGYFEVSDGARMHTCHVDDSGRVSELKHPGAEG